MNFNQVITATLFVVCVTNIQAQEVDIKKIFFTGQYKTAIEKWETLLATKQSIQAWVGIAKAYRYLGLPDKALKILTTTLPVTTPINQAILLNELSKLHLSQAKVKAAKQATQDALRIIRPINNQLVLAEILRQLGNVQTAEDEYEAATKSYAEALTLIAKSNPMVPYFSADDVRELYGKILVNQAQTAFWFDANNAYQYSDTKQAFKSSIDAVLQATEVTKNWPDAFSEIFALIAISKVIQNIQIKLPEPKLSQLNYQVLNQAQKIAERINNDQAKTHVYGYLGQLYEHNKRYPEALILTRKALFAAQQIQEQLSMYRWQWQLGRIFKAQNKSQEAIAAFKQAIKIINSLAIRDQLMATGSNNFREQIAPVYFTLADLLLQRGDTASVREARDTIESFKQAELQDYFKNECLTTQCTHLEQALDSQTAILYPIVLPDRLELLLSLPNVTKLVRVKVLVSEKKLRREIALLVSSLRRHPLSYIYSEEEDEVICTPDSWQQSETNISPRAEEFLEPAQKLYRWLINPLLGSLNNINTLIIVPEGVLRTVPFAALHDGKEFLIQKYALANTPSLCLTDLQAQPRTVDKMLVSGLSESVQGFSDLPCAKYEIDTLQKLHNLYGVEYKPLFNNDFTYKNMQQRVNQTRYSIVHIASHGQFKPDLADTFLLTYDDKLSMDKLEKLVKRTNSQKIDLLTLSACETAVGNDRAALGLAGVALKAGVKSALASLWKVDDAATPAMIIEFYQQLANPKLTKAQALQNAQRMMLTNAKYAQFQHPYYWSAFLLIGNWF